MQSPVAVSQPRPGSGSYVSHPGYTHTNPSPLPVRREHGQVVWLCLSTGCPLQFECIEGVLATAHHITLAPHGWSLLEGDQTGREIPNAERYLPHCGSFQLQRRAWLSPTNLYTVTRPCLKPRFTLGSHHRY